MRTLNTQRKFKGSLVQVAYTRGGSHDEVITARTTHGDGSDELMYLLGFKPTATRGPWAYYQREFCTSVQAKLFVAGQRQWRV